MEQELYKVGYVLSPNNIHGCREFYPAGPGVKVRPNSKWEIITVSDANNSIMVLKDMFNGIPKLDSVYLSVGDYLKTCTEISGGGVCFTGPGFDD